MGSGVAGGRIGAAVVQSLERRYGKAKSSIGVGAFAVLASLVLAVIYSVSQPVVVEADVSPVQVRVSRYNVRRSSLDIWSGDTVYTARPRFWRPAVPDERLESALGANHTVTLWLYPNDHRIYGLHAGDLTIPTSAGVAEYMSNRFWFLMIWVGFLIGGVGTVLHGLWLRRREARIEQAA